MSPRAIVDARAGLVVAWAALVLAHACVTDPGPSPDERLAECRTDDDCALLPSQLTCCGECDPLPPFEAVPRTTIDGLLIELETRCAEKPTPCDAFRCDIAPPGCQATAACLGGRCAVVQSDTCGRLIASTER